MFEAALRVAVILAILLVTLAAGFALFWLWAHAKPLLAALGVLAIVALVLAGLVFAGLALLASGMQA